MAAAHSSQINTCSVLSTDAHSIHVSGTRWRRKKEYDFDIKQEKREKGTHD